MNSAIVSSIDIYPIKSTAGISLSNAWVDQYGLSFDRRFVLTDHNGQFITARTKSKLCLISSSLTQGGLALTAPNMPSLMISYAHFSESYQKIHLWQDTIDAQHCASTYDQWFSQYLNTPCQLLYFGQQSKRLVANSNKQVAFADGYPLLLITQASLDDLNSHLPDINLPMAQFRPNIVVNNTAAFAEDSWRNIRIGHVEFELVKPCSRCIFTTINTISGEKHKQQEPLNTLKNYRQVASGEVMFGQNLIALNQGKISLGDKVQITKKQSPPVFIINNTANKNQPSQQKKVYSSADKLTLQCIKIVQETHDVKTFILKNEVNEPIQYLAGQHLPISLEINGKSIQRCYTLSSAPTRPEQLAITVKRVNDNNIAGTVSNYLHDNFALGSKIVAKQPQGQFHLTSHTKPTLFLSAGSGITPMLSMLRTLTDSAAASDIVFFHSAHTEQDLIAADEISALAKQQGHCRIEYTLTQHATAQWSGYQGRLNKDMLINIANLVKREVYVCGPKAFRDKAQTLLEQLGLPSEQFHFESFGERKPLPKLEPVDPINKKINILFNGWNIACKGNTEETLLEQAEAAGLILPYSCRGGMCGSCRVKLESGDVEQLSQDGLSDIDQQQGYILACACIPKSDIVINKA
jgi:hypothetical protein